MDLFGIFEIAKIFVPLALSVTSLSLTILIFRWTRRARVQMANSVIDIIGREIDKIDQLAVTDSLNELHSNLNKLHFKVDKLLKEKGT